MPTCNHCNNKWSWKQTIKQTMTLSPELYCPYCEGKQYQSQKSKRNQSILTMMTLLPLLLQAFFNIPTAMLLSLIPILAAIVFIAYPFLVELTNEEEFLFK